ncbi:N-acetylglucosaminyl deacetylase, LmbE family [Amycolatopsis xylanica]|uniref:N-acetylglucosaminyl deacetylase, LmbE family n=1 Tax=Amycolatopsis xylanica TaxID=589385 RepID=A0A1H2VFS3_9PSEU|nr:bifunctional PIG-L family deacetylase/class I SAM-dependent methyltransferase [Amycolatopsis xylanica]SDW66739.1 N-acetylglucosaminyl deacetylase, LmbE family [Amycolatopsis xylanica]
MTEYIPESHWRPALAARELRPFPASGFTSALVVAAHPDDETLGAAGLLQRLHAEGTEITLVIATDGEAAFPESTSDERRELGRLRRTELADSLTAQGLHEVEPVWLGLPDSGLSAHAGELTAALAELATGRELCLAPWPGDPHPDHQAAGLATLRAAPVTSHCWSYPIWLWHWLADDDPAIPWSRAFAYPLDQHEQAGKAAAVAAFASQLKPGPRGEDPILPPEVLAHFARDTEVFFREPPTKSAPHSRFAELYGGAPDPWQVSTRWYERRKRAVALAALPDQHYGFVVEPACGTGVLTRELAARCDRLLAFDPVPAAVAQATTSSTVDVRVGALPSDLPPSGVDLLVYSEILYYLDDAELTETIERSVAALRPGGQLLAVHWLHWAAEAPRDGRDAHRRLLERPEFDVLVEHTDEQFLLHVLRRR